MKSPRWQTLGQVALLVLPLLGLGYLAWNRYRQPTVPTYEGKTLAQWIGDLRDPDYTIGDRAADALVHAGSDAVPVLLEARKDGDIRLHRRAAAALVRIGAPAAPGLVAALKDGPNERVETALVRMGPNAVPALIDALPQEKVGKEAARVLGLMGPRAADAVPALIGVVQQRQAAAGLREEAAGALGRIGIPAKDIVVVLSAALQDEKPEMRRRAAAALLWIGPPAREAVPALIAALKDDRPEVVSAACLVLGQVGDAGTVPPLLAAFRSSRDEIAKAAGWALWNLGPTVPVIVPALIPLAKGTEKESLHARALLVSIGSFAVPALTAALRDDEATVRRMAAEVLGLIGPVARESVPALAGLLKDTTPAVALAAALALAQIDPTRAREAVPRLADSLDTPTAVEALAEIGPDARAAVPALIAALKPRKNTAEDNALRDAARYALARIGPPAVPALLDALKDTSDGVAPWPARRWAGCCRHNSRPSPRCARRSSAIAPTPVSTPSPSDNSARWRATPYTT